MGLIRKSMAVGTVGTVRPNSKKQRTAKATMKSSAAAANAAAEQAQMQQAMYAQQQQAIAQANYVAEQQAQEEREFRYATDPAYRKFIDDKQAAQRAAQAAQAAQVAEQARVARVRAAEFERVRLEQQKARHEANVRRAKAIRAATVVALRFVAVALVVLLLAVFVWMPEFVVAKIRRQPAKLWMRDRIRFTRKAAA